MNNIIERAVMTMYNDKYPVGAIYLSIEDDPNELFGGKWAEIERGMWMRHALYGEEVEEDKDVLRYGKVLTDDRVKEDSMGYGVYHNVRIRTILYEQHVYYHLMRDGEVVEFKELI